MKKRTAILTIFIFFCLYTCAAAQMRIKILYGASELKSDTAPMIVNNRTMVPMRVIFEALGAEVDYDGAAKKVTAQKDNSVIEFAIGSGIMTVNGEEKKLDSPAFINNNRTLVPVRACAEALLCDVEWYEKARIVKIRKGAWVLSEEKNSGGYFEKNTYDDRGNLIKKEYPTQYGEYTYDELGNVTSFIANTGYYYKKTYDEYGNLKTETTSGQTTEYFYDENRNITYTEITSKGSPNPRKETYFYDGKNNLVKIEGEDGAYKKYEYDSNGNVTYYEHDGIWNKSQYDENGKITRLEDSNGMITEYIYEENRLVLMKNSDGFSQKNTYENGRLVLTEESDGYTVKYSYDDSGKLCETSDSNGNIKTYDENGNVIRQVNGDNITEYSYLYFNI